MTLSFSMLGKDSTIISSKVFSYPFFSSSSGTPITQILVHFILSQMSLRLASVLFILFSLFCSSEIISNILSFRSLIRSSTSNIQLLIPSRIFLISVIVFVSVCVLFNSSRSLLIVLHFLHFVFKLFDNLYYHYSEFFSGSLPISSSFIWTSVFLVYSFIYAVFLCLFSIFNLLCLRSPFPRLQRKWKSCLEEG